MEYVIVDIETSGRSKHQTRITEICAIRIKDSDIVDKFVTLVNPRVRIPDYITGITGIDDTMVRDAPSFEEVAERIVEITRNAVFVAHNVNFDYTVLRSEFRHLGYEFKRQKLCTVRLSKKLIPGMFSYSLGKLCASLAIPLENRHRAEGDADATRILFDRLYILDDDGIIFDSFLNSRKKKLPANLDSTTIAKLPQRPGVYFFRNGEGNIIYVGKAIRIKERVLSHFYYKMKKDLQLCAETRAIDFVETGSELLALLVEADEIQRHLPQFNLVQKKLRPPYCVVHYKNQKGIIQFAIDRKSAMDLGSIVFYNRERAVERLRKLCSDYELCPKYTGLGGRKTPISSCADCDCKKICEGKESIAIYNIRAKRATAGLYRELADYAILLEGRADNEHGFVLIRDNVYRGYGFFEKDRAISGLFDLEAFLIPLKNTYHTSRIIHSYLSTNPKSSRLMVPETISAEK